MTGINKTERVKWEKEPNESIKDTPKSFLNLPPLALPCHPQEKKKRVDSLRPSEEKEKQGKKRRKSVKAMENEAKRP